MIDNVKIVVVDEDKLVRDFIVDVLEFCVNRKVTSFNNGIAAWEYIQQPDNPHIVISDAAAPEMNGFDLLKNIKETYPEKTCIIMSHQYKNEKIAQDLGADAFLAKPFYIDELFELVQKYVVEK
jgi:CheY-like chemotaxis protein